MQLTHFLYTINFVVSLYTSNYIWKLLNFLLIITSWTCDKFGGYFLILDYLCIFFISLCFLNNLYLNTLFVIAMIYEYCVRKSIVIVKNIAFVVAAMLHAFTMNGFQLFLLCLTVTSLSVYVIRYYYPNDYLTFLWRFCTMLIMVTASYNLN